MFTIANDLTKMQIETLVSEADVGGVREGQAVTFTVDAFPGRKFNGKVNQVRFAPITNANVVNYTAVVEVDNRDLRLRPGMTANASIITAQRTNILYAPNSALRFRPPESVAIGSTNDAVAKAAGTNAPGLMRPAGDMPTPPWVAERRRPTDDERKKYEDSLTPEQKEQYRQMREMMRARMAEGGGPRGGGGGGGGESGGPGGGGSGGGFGGMFGGAQRSNANDGPAIRTVYVLDKERSTTGKPVLKAVVVKTGIADGTNTEIQEGLAEGEVLVTGLKTTTTTATAPTANPFGPSFGPRR
jgi:HlyD family secretion protein